MKNTCNHNFVFIKTLLQKEFFCDEEYFNEDDFIYIIVNRYKCSKCKDEFWENYNNKNYKKGEFIKI